MSTGCSSFQTSSLETTTCTSAAPMKTRKPFSFRLVPVRLWAALKLDSENADLHRELGITFLLGKDWKRARVEMLEAIRHDPTDADAYNGLGYALEKMGDLNEAVKQYRLATQLDPQDPTYRTHYFDILSKLAQEKAKKK